MDTPKAVSAGVTEAGLALSKVTIGTVWASRVFFPKKYYSNGFFEFTITDFLG